MLLNLQKIYLETICLKKFPKRINYLNKLQNLHLITANLTAVKVFSLFAKAPSFFQNQFLRKPKLGAIPHQGESFSDQSQKFQTSFGTQRMLLNLQKIYLETICLKKLKTFPKRISKKIKKISEENKLFKQASKFASGNCQSHSSKGFQPFCKGSRLSSQPVPQEAKARSDPHQGESFSDQSQKFSNQFSQI